MVGKWKSWPKCVLSVWEKKKRDIWLIQYMIVKNVTYTTVKNNCREFGINISQTDSAVSILSSICGICFDQNNTNWQKQCYQWLYRQVLRHLPFKTAHTVHLVCTKPLLLKWSALEDVCYKQTTTAATKSTREGCPIIKTTSLFQHCETLYLDNCLDIVKM